MKWFLPGAGGTAPVSTSLEFDEVARENDQDRAGGRNGTGGFRFTFAAYERLRI
jgi:hypothetical protein